MNTLFTRSQHWKQYDIFGRQKLETFKSSQRAILELSQRYKDLIEQLNSSKSGSVSAEKTPEAERLLFEEIAEACLWGNATGMKSRNRTHESI